MKNKVLGLALCALVGCSVVSTVSLGVGVVDPVDRQKLMGMHCFRECAEACGNDIHNVKSIKAEKGFMICKCGGKDVFTFDHLCENKLLQ